MHNVQRQNSSEDLSLQRNPRSDNPGNWKRNTALTVAGLGTLLLLGGGGVGAAFAAGALPQLAGQLATIIPLGSGFLALVGGGGTYILVRPDSRPRRNSVSQGLEGEESHQPPVAPPSIGGSSNPVDSDARPDRRRNSIPHEDGKAEKKEENNQPPSSNPNGHENKLPPKPTDSPPLPPIPSDPLPLPPACGNGAGQDKNDKEADLSDSASEHSDVASSNSESEKEGKKSPPPEASNSPHQGSDAGVSTSLPVEPKPATSENSAVPSSQWLIPYPAQQRFQPPSPPVYKAKNEQKGIVVKARDVKNVDLEAIAVKEGMHPKLLWLMMDRALNPIQHELPEPIDPRRAHLQELVKDMHSVRIKDLPQEFLTRSAALRQDDIPQEVVVSMLEHSFALLNPACSQLHQLIKERQRLGLRNPTPLIPKLMYAVTDIANHKATYNDDDIIDFTKDWLEKVPSKVEHLGDIKNSVAIFCYLLRETYGVELANTVIKRYQIDKLQEIRGKTIKECLIGIAANVKKKDLKKLFYDLKKDPNDRLMMCGFSLNREQVEALRRYDKFNELPPEAIAILLLPFRTLFVGQQRVPTIDAVPKDLLEGRVGTSFGDDVEILLALEEIKEMNMSQYQISLSEHISKNIAYLRLKKGMVIPLVSEHGSLIFYDVNTDFEDKSDGVVPSTMIPINRSQDSYWKHNRMPVFFNMRGTESRGNGKDNWQTGRRDAQTAVVGVGVWDREARKAELKKLARILFTKYPDVPLDFFVQGHSLGAADSQGNLTYILETFVELLSEPGAEKFSKNIHFHVYAHNPPGTTMKDNENFLELVAKLDKYQKQGIIDCRIDITLVLFNTKQPVQSTDVVPSADEVYIGAGCESKLVRRRVILCDKPGLTNLQAHTSKAFVGEGKFEIAILSEKDRNPETLKEIDKIFRKKWYWDKDAQGIHFIVQHIKWQGGKIFTPILNAIPGRLFYYTVAAAVNTYDWLVPKTSNDPRREDPTGY